MDDLMIVGVVLGLLICAIFLELLDVGRDIETAIIELGNQTNVTPCETPELYESCEYTGQICRRKNENE